MPDVPQRVENFYGRQQLIVAKVFLGLHAKEEINYEEQSEKYDVTIHENPLLWKMNNEIVEEQSGWMTRMDAAGSRKNKLAGEKIVV